MTAPGGAQAQFLYRTNNYSITIIGYRGTDRTVTIHSTINGLPVVGIGDSAFQNASVLTNVTIATGVTRIGIYSFHSCTNLVTPNGEATYSRQTPLFAWLVESQVQLNLDSVSGSFGGWRSIIVGAFRLAVSTFFVASYFSSTTWMLLRLLSGGPPGVALVPGCTK